MATFETVQAQPFGSVAIFRVTTFVENAFTAFVTWNKNRKAKAELATFTDRELLDIGLSRGEINALFKS